jgi:hypothetical protein
MARARPGREEAAAFIRPSLAEGVSVKLLDTRDAGDRLIGSSTRMSAGMGAEGPNPHGELIAVRDGKVTEMFVNPTVD